MKDLRRKHVAAEKRYGAGLSSRWIGLLILLFVLASPAPHAAAAADWDSALDEIHNLYSDYTGLQTALKSETARTQTLRKQNNTDLAAINLKLRAIDSVLLKRLKSEAEAMKKKHAPLLEEYTSLSKQIAAARKAGNLKSATLLEIKRNKLKAAATAARAEVKAKNTAFAEARTLTAAKIKPAKDALAPVAGLKKQITAQNKAASSAQTERAEAHKRYKAAIASGDAITAAAAMKLAYARMGELRTFGQQSYAWEQKITVALRAAEAKLPK
ncbi:hypothetical protein AMQ84_10805 [Paenibacillus riograndensis]|uniref:Colicin import membrane protein n=1 Tax=Paenibacillus riograndensis TaxID=483937 RepID=A0A132U335_9BACL|nr:hypothetical protein [Paenibacillus riograndensis]KWX77961.1 hypothetical protein AMQ84_10805 [Paenibacillus riograndensis]KWX83464.1 hypothetical protein AMQ83_31255 [Paenibacillus riograndensis]